MSTETSATTIEWQYTEEDVYRGVHEIRLANPKTWALEKGAVPNVLDSVTDERLRRHFQVVKRDGYFYLKPNADVTMRLFASDSNCFNMPFMEAFGVKLPDNEELVVTVHTLSGHDILVVATRSEWEAMNRYHHHGCSWDGPRLI